MITDGTVLIEKGTLFPEALRFQNESHADDWVSLADDPGGSKLEKQLATAGWTISYMAGQIRTIAFGFSRRRMVRAALNRLVAKVRLDKCNCLEIDNVGTHSLLGMPYVTVSGHSRHIAKSV